MALLLILGGGESGVGAAILAKKQGIPCCLSEKGELAPTFKEELERHQIQYEEGGHSALWIEKATEVIKSPGIPDSSPIIQDFIKREIPVISEIEFAFRYVAANSHIIALTGSNGKTTSVSWITYILQKDHRDAIACGNVGKSFARLVALDPHDYYVLELSSFQLDGCYSFHPHISLLLNISPDHLDRYNYQFSLYAASKLRITQNLKEDDYFIYWKEDPFISKNLKKGSYSFQEESFALDYKDGNVYFNTEKQSIVFKETKSLASCSISEKDLALVGKHNILNAMAVGLVCRALNVPNEVMLEGLSSFINVPHRIEKIATIKGVEYINDSKATNINSTYYALEAQKKPVLLILGGQDKGNDYREIEELVVEKCKALLFLCKDNQKLHQSFDGKVKLIRDAFSMAECIEIAQSLAEDGDVVLLSPACASFDLFKSYEDRGNQFRNIVLKSI